MRTIGSAPATERVGRYPAHRFQLTKEQPFAITPFMIAPVLPGETMSSAYMEARVISDPILNPIIGWKKEFWWFYCSISDLLTEQLKEMFVDPTNTDLSDTLGIGADSTPFFTAKGGIDYAKRAYIRVVESYFRDEGVAWDARTFSSGLAVAEVKERGWMHSLTDEADMPLGAAIEGAETQQELENLRNAFEMMRLMGMTDMTYEDFLRASGQKVPEASVGRPELLWHMSQFQYPSNTIDPTDGTPTSAVSWVFKEQRKGKSMLFREPGFIIGITCTRPKIYLGGQYGNMSAHLSRAWDWLPAYLPADMAETRLKHFAAGTGPLGDRSGTSGGLESEYWVDVADLFIHGDEWRDFNLDNALTRIDALHTLGLPSWYEGEDTLNQKYLGEGASKSFFVDSAGTKYYVRSDGFVSLGIKGKVVDLTQTGVQTFRNVGASE